MPLERGEINDAVGVQRTGVIIGLEFRLPASGLAAVYDGGWARLKSATIGKEYDEYAVAASSKTFTASKDTYAYLNGADGVLTYVEVANGGAKPTQSAIGDNSQWLAKVITDGSNITSVLRLKREATHGRLERLTWLAGFASTTVGAVFFKALSGCRLLMIRGAVTTALAGTDDGTVTAAIGSNGTFTAVTGGVLTIPLSSALSARAQVVATGANQASIGDEIRFTSAKTTSGGQAMCEAIIEVLA